MLIMAKKSIKIEDIVEAICDERVIEACTSRLHDKVIKIINDQMETKLKEIIADLKKSFWPMQKRWSQIPLMIYLSEVIIKSWPWMKELTNWKIIIYKKTCSYLVYKTTDRVQLWKKKIILPQVKFKAL